MSNNGYQEIQREREAALRGVRPEIANRQKPAQAFNRGTDSGREAAQSREVTNYNQPRKE
jgi:hypothetical protein